MSCRFAITQGIILLFPNVFHYHPELLTIPTRLRITPDQSIAFEHATIRDLLLNENPEHRNAMLDLFVSMGRQVSKVEREQLLSEVDQYERENPIRFRLTPGFFDKHFGESKTRSEMFLSSNGGLPLIHASQIAETTGSFLIFEHQFAYEVLSTNFDQKDKKADSLQQLSLAFQQLEFQFLHNVPSKKALELRKQGYLLSFRNYLRELWQAVTTIENQQLLDTKIADFRDRLTSEYIQLEKEWEQIRKDLVVSAAITGMVSGLTVVAPGSIALGLTAATAAGFGIAGYQNIKELRQTNQKPLSVFLKLAH